MSLKTQDQTHTNIQTNYHTTNNQRPTVQDLKRPYSSNSDTNTHGARQRRHTRSNSLVSDLDLNFIYSHARKESIVINEGIENCLLGHLTIDPLDEDCLLPPSNVTLNQCLNSIKGNQASLLKNPDVVYAMSSERNQRRKDQLRLNKMKRNMKPLDIDAINKEEEPSYLEDFEENDSLNNARSDMNYDYNKSDCIKISEFVLDCEKAASPNTAFYNSFSLKMDKEFSYLKLLNQGVCSKTRNGSKDFQAEDKKNNKIPSSNEENPTEAESKMRVKPLSHISHITPKTTNKQPQSNQDSNSAETNPSSSNMPNNPSFSNQTDKTNLRPDEDQAEVNVSNLDVQLPESPNEASNLPSVSSNFIPLKNNLHVRKQSDNYTESYMLALNIDEEALHTDNEEEQKDDLAKVVDSDRDKHVRLKSGLELFIHSVIEEETEEILTDSALSIRKKSLYYSVSKSKDMANFNGNSGVFVSGNKSRLSINHNNPSGQTPLKLNFDNQMLNSVSSSIEFIRIEDNSNISNCHQSNIFIDNKKNLSNCEILEINEFQAKGDPGEENAIPNESSDCKPIRKQLEDISKRISAEDSLNKRQIEEKKKIVMSLFLGESQLVEKKEKGISNVRDAFYNEEEDSQSRNEDEFFDAMRAKYKKEKQDRKKSSIFKSEDLRISSNLFPRENPSPILKGVNLQASNPDDIDKDSKSTGKSCLAPQKRLFGFMGAAMTSNHTANKSLFSANNLCLDLDNRISIFLSTNSQAKQLNCGFRNLSMSREIDIDILKSRALKEQVACKQESLSYKLEEKQFKVTSVQSMNAIYIKKPLSGKSNEVKEKKEEPNAKLSNTTNSFYK